MPALLMSRSPLELARKIRTLHPGRWTALIYLPLLALLAWQLVYWTQLFLTPPRPQAAATQPSLDTDRLLETVRAAHLFGAADSSSTDTTSNTSLDLQLHGVFAAHGKLPAMAIIKVENKGDLPFSKGDSVLPGVTLEAIEPDHVILRRSGITERLVLEQKVLPQDLAVPIAAQQPAEPEPEAPDSLMRKLGQQAQGNR